jgi:serine/threonine-protein kinase
VIELKGQIGKYKILKKLGSGGFGTIYLSEDTYLKTLRALKIPHRIGTETEKLLQESVLQSKLLDHPHIVKLLTVDIIDGTIIMVMEYIKGTDIETLIDAEEKLSVKTSLHYFKQILSALEFAHKHKVIHRDIRPSNILIDEKNNIKITDFGTSTLLNEKQYATTRIGSPPYMAPEQFEGKAVFPSDIYSAGCLFYEMVTGFPPIVMANPMEIYKMAKAGNITPLIKKNTSVSTRLNWILMKTLSPDLSTRYKTVTELITDFNNMEGAKEDNAFEIKSIKNRITARNKRTDYVCWNCHKTMPRKMKKCLYCDTEQ